MVPHKKTNTKRSGSSTLRNNTKSSGSSTTKKEHALIDAPIYSMAGKQVSNTALPKELFGAPWRADLVHQVATAQEANARQNRAHTKDRAEVSGGGRKPWKQKGTGQARHGSSRSPLWRHGGVTFGPRSDRDYHEKINRRMKGSALASVLSRKAKEGEIILIEKLVFSAPKTAVAKAALKAIASGAGAATLATKRKNAAIIALVGYDAHTIKSFRNLGNVKTEEARNLSVVDLLTHKYLVLEAPETTFKTLAARLTK